MSKKFVIIGNYGAGNWGDELLCVSTVKGIKENFDDAEITVLAADPQLAQQNCELGDVTFLHLFPAGLRSAFDYTFTGKLKQTMLAVKEADVVLFGGGGLLNAEVPRSLSIWGRQIKMAAKLGKPIAMLGQSFPMANLESLTFKHLLDKVGFVTVRDPISYDALARLKPNVIVKKATDLVLGLDLNFAAETVEDAIVVNFRFYQDLDDEAVIKWGNTITKFILENTDYKVRFLCMDANDVEFAELLMEILPDTDRFEVVEPKSQAELLQAYASAKGVIAMRLHALILGFMANKPVLGLSYNDKVKGWLKMVEIDKELIDLQMEVDLAEAETVSRMQSFLSKANEGINNTDKIKKLRAKSQLSFEYLKGWLA